MDGNRSRFYLTYLILKILHFALAIWYCVWYVLYVYDMYCVYGMFNMVCTMYMICSMCHILQNSKLQKSYAIARSRMVEILHILLRPCRLSTLNWKYDNANPNWITSGIRPWNVSNLCFI